MSRPGDVPLVSTIAIRQGIEPGQPEMSSSCGCRADENGLFHFDLSSGRVDLVKLQSWELLFYSCFEHEVEP